MAGTTPGFNGNDFRTAIRFVYGMAAPAKVEEQVYFYFAPTVTYNHGVDSDNVPFNPASTRSHTQAAAVQVPCGIEFKDSRGATVDFGVVEAAQLILTLLDQDYVRVATAQYVVLRGQRYTYKRTVPPTSLFSVSLHEMIFESESAT